MFCRGRMVAEFVIESAKRKMDERRRCGCRPYDRLSARDRVLDLESVPASLVVPEDLICREIEFKNASRVIAAFGREHLPNEESENTNKEKQEEWKAGHVQHERDDPKGERVLSPFLQRSAWSFFDRGVLHNSPKYKRYMPRVSARRTDIRSATTSFCPPLSVLQVRLLLSRRSALPVSVPPPSPAAKPSPS